MKKTLLNNKKFYFLALSLFLMAVGCKKNESSPVSEEPVLGAKGNLNKLLKDFQQVNLVGNTDEYDPRHMDPLLVNSWGLAFSSNGIAWTGAQGGHVSTVYDREGVTVRPAVNIPSPGGATGGNPSGVVFSGSNTAFRIPNPGTNDSVAARFIFVGLDGQISAWNANQGNNAFRVLNMAGTSTFTGAVIAANNLDTNLYAANFRTGHINVWNKQWHPLSMSFTDPGIPAGYSPFNIESIGNQLYVMYAKVGPNGRSTEHPGDGFISVFNTDGSFVKRFTSKGQLNAPWGIAKAPAHFFDDEETTENVILVGNFGDGRINAFDSNGNFLGQLRKHGQPIRIEGLWAIKFAPATSTIDPNRLYFTAGPDEETEGLFGYITKE